MTVSLIVCSGQSTKPKITDLIFVVVTYPPSGDFALHSSGYSSGLPPNNKLVCMRTRRSTVH